MRVLLPKRYLKGMIAFLLFLIGTAALVGATLPASYQQQLGLSASGSIFADLFNLQPTNPFVVNYAPPAPMPGNPAADLDQCADDPMPSSHFDGCNSSATQWVNGNLGASKSVYFEGDSIPYRMKFTNLPLGAHAVTIEWDTTKSSKHAIDYITNWNQSVADANPCLGISGCVFPGTSGVNYTETAIPVDPQVSGAGVTPIAGKLRLYGGTINSVSAGDYSYPNGAGFTGDKSARLVITFTASVANPVLAWGGHISTRKDWTDGGSAVAIPGSPYHTRLINLDGSGGNQDRSLSADAVIFPGSVTIIKDRQPNNGPEDFSFTATNLSPTTFKLDDDADGTLSNTKVFSEITTFDTKTVTETSDPNFALSLGSPPCTVTSANGGSSGVLGNPANGVTINMKEGEKYTCIFTNTAKDEINGKIIVKKFTDPSGDTATNFKFHPTGFASDTDFNADFFLKDGGSLDSCKTAGIKCLTPSVAPGTYKVTEVTSDTPNYTLTKEECVSSDPLRLNSTPSTGIPVVAGETVTCTFTNTLNNPKLIIDKVATESGFSKLNDVIHYTITAKNDGNVTLTNVNVTDSQVTDLSCTPAVPVASLAPGASITCTASHTITQADLDAATFYNQACVDDNPDLAAKACDDVTTPGTKLPGLSIVKKTNGTDNNTAPGLLVAVGSAITWTYDVTNTGNITLFNVTVTDDKLADSAINCDGDNVITSLAPGGSTQCTASGTAIAGQYTNTGTATSGLTHASDPDNYFGQSANVSGSYPTQTTCQQFISNTIQPQEDGTYMVKGGKINQAAPGVIFYYSRWTPSHSTQFIDQAILSDLGFTQTMVVQSVGLFKASDCSSAPGTVTTNFTVDSIPDPNGIKLTGLNTSLEYVVAVKYSVSSLKGATPPSSGTIVYQFQTRDNDGAFTIVTKDDNGFTLIPK